MARTTNSNGDEKHVPRPIEENPIYRAIQDAEHLLELVYQGRIPALIFYGPPGMGKTTLAERVARRCRQRFCPERPGTALGLLETIYKHRRGGVIVLDDIDHLWGDGKALDILKVALDTRQERYLSHTVGGSGKNSRRPFQVRCGAVFLSNRNFADKRQFSQKTWEHVQAIKDRGVLVGLSFDALDAYEYVGWLSAEKNILGTLSANFQPGETIAGKDGPITITKRNRNRSLSLDERNHVLRHFAANAHRYPNISPRHLAKFAKLRIGADTATWERLIEGQLTGAWKLPAKLHVYQIEPAKAASADSEPPDSCPENAFEPGGLAIPEMPSLQEALPAATENEDRVATTAVVCGDSADRPIQHKSRREPALTSRGDRTRAISASFAHRSSRTSPVSRRRIDCALACGCQHPKVCKEQDRCIEHPGQPVAGAGREHDSMGRHVSSRMSS